MPEPNDAVVWVWEDDPGSPDENRQPIQRPVPQTRETPLPTDIHDAAPAPGDVELTPDALRYWTSADALDRGTAFWLELAPDVTGWQEEVGARLGVTLDQGVKLNAEYRRDGGLFFFHQEVAGVPTFTAECPDIVCHELGHAILDAIRPELWDAMGEEIAAFHEAFGDISALLVALQLPSLREHLLAETGGDLWRSSRLSRIGERLGWALRQISPQRAERDCLRDAANEWFYRDPSTLPPQAPATMLSSAPHSFSRVFTGAFLKALAGIIDPDDVDAQSLSDATRVLGQLLVDAIREAPVTPGYFSQIAAHMLVADGRRFDGRHVDALKFAFVRHGVLALSSATELTGDERPAQPQAEGAAREAWAEFPGRHYGLDEDLRIRVPTAAPALAAEGSAPDYAGIQAPSAKRAAECFVEDLFRLGRVDIGEAANSPRSVSGALAYKTHRIETGAEAATLRRQVFDCGFLP